MVVTHNVKGWDEFAKKMEELETTDGKNPVHVLFSGGKDEAGVSWCPYCVKAEPVIHDALKKAPENSHFVHVDVGERAYWKDLNCPFRKDVNTHLVFLPTLLRWKQPQRLDGERCSNKDLVEMLFEDED
ncbi:thioredoxin domain-containing protein 17 [Drosophila sulfurigaster albostrigata]|uniref:thioredoxin domain-containing protein 17 n=1 Tax=Drosophila nasuta TaxID=42062 RepID=UPI00295E9BA2|nr:thioredoxin domain-containing protein 17 [Drosophila nasuta]XP_062136621.1 thioredoxin domain-containing protein 17 [Drosophila sulfurigaster albostrigata]